MRWGGTLAHIARVRAAVARRSRLFRHGGREGPKEAPVLLLVGKQAFGPALIADCLDAQKRDPVLVHSLSKVFVAS